MSESQEGSQEGPRIASIGSVLAQFQSEPVDWQAVEQALLAREDHVVDVLHSAGMQFGLFPQIVAEVLAEVGLGHPRSAAERQMLRDQYRNLMLAIERAQRGEGPMPQP